MGWLEMYPQHGYVPLANGGYEQVTVGVAQNANPVSKGHCSAFNLPNAYGRNFTVQKVLIHEWKAICTDGIFKSNGIVL